MARRRFVNSDTIADYAELLIDFARSALMERGTRHRFQLPFLSIDAFFSDPGFVAACRKGLVEREATDGCRRAELEVHVMSATDPRWPEPAVWREPMFSLADLDRVISGKSLRGYYHHECRFWQFWNVQTNCGVQSMLSTDLLPPWELSAPLRSFLHWRYDRMGMRLVHAATLGLNGKGILLAGRGGAGKSGTTLAGLANGLSSVGDDYVLLQRDKTGPYRAHAIFSTMKQDMAGLQRTAIDLAQLDSKGPNWQGKIEFDLNAIRANALSDSFEVTALLLPRIAHRTRSVIRPARPAEAMVALAPSGLFQMPGCVVSGVRFYSEFIRRTPAYHIELSNQPDEIADVIHAFLANRRLAHAG